MVVPVAGVVVSRRGSGGDGGTEGADGKRQGQDPVPVHLSSEIRGGGGSAAKLSPPLGTDVSIPLRRSRPGAIVQMS